MVYTYKGIVFSLKKEGNPARLWMKHKDIMLNEIKPVTERQVLYDSTYVWYLEESNS